MNTTVLRDRITELLAPILAADGMDLEEVEVTPAGRRRVLRVVVDSDTGVSLDQLADASHAIAGALDNDDSMGAGSYTLEVTSRGVDRPLVAPRHWRRNIGRLVKIGFTEGKQLIGRIQDADDAGADIEVGSRAVRVSYTEVARARIEVEFRDTEPGNEDEDEEGA